MRWVTNWWTALTALGLTALVGVFILIAFWLVPPENRHIAFVGAIESGIKVLTLPHSFYFACAAIVIAKIFFDYLRGRVS